MSVDRAEKPLKSLWISISSGTIQDMLTKAAKQQSSKAAKQQSSKQGKGSTFCTLLVGRLRPQAPDLPAFHAVVVG